MRIFAMLAVSVMLTGSANAQVPQSCDGELRQLRYLVQLYQAGRTSTEFALAQAEARRQALEELVKTLETELKSARGQK